MKRIPTDELLDNDAGTPAEVQASIEDLRWFNRWFGGVSTGKALLQRVARRCRSTRLSLLEVASGGGYVPSVLQRHLAVHGITLAVTLLDRAHSHLQNGSSFPRIVADARVLPFRDNSFDLVGSSLFAHHLSPEELVHFVTESLRVCRNAVLVNDLIRDRIHLATAYAGIPLYRSRITRNDAPASVRQAYTCEEMRNLLGKTPAARLEASRHYFYRMGVIAWKK